MPQLRMPDPKCCNNCAVFLAALERGYLPPIVAETLARLGVDPRRPDEVWGAADGGSLLGWWSFVGVLPIDHDAAIAHEHRFEVAPGFQIYPDASVNANHAAFVGQRVMSLSFIWESDALMALDRDLFNGVYPPPAT